MVPDFFNYEGKQYTDLRHLFKHDTGGYRGGVRLSEETVRGEFPQWEWIGSGITRTVFALSSRRVIKFEQNLARPLDRNYNRQEVRTWLKFAGTEDARWFLPVLAAHPDGQWLIMPRIKACDGRFYGTKHGNQAERAMDRLGIGDMWSGNFGWYKGKVVALDYAVSH